jgi:small subunit ribosomal protein S6
MIMHLFSDIAVLLRPDTPDDRVQQILDRITRGVAADGGQIVKVSPWGKRRLAYPIDSHREGSYFITVFDAPSEAVAELERGLNITEEIMRHLVTRIERPSSARRPGRAEDGEGPDDLDLDLDDDALPPVEDEDAPDGEFIDESESEAAPRATD